MPIKLSVFQPSFESAELNWPYHLHTLILPATDVDGWPFRHARQAGGQRGRKRAGRRGWQVGPWPLMKGREGRPEEGRPPSRPLARLRRGRAKQK